MASIEVTVSAFDVPEVQTELDRLRALIKATPFSDYCPWCGRDKSDPHTHDCRAFTPEGKVK